MEPKVHYCVRKSPSLDSILSQINPVNTTLSYLSKIHFIILTCMSVTIDGVWLGNWIYWTLTDCNYK
jgi:hypothetical protein